MSATETVLLLFAAVHSSVIVYLCFDRDQLLKRIIELESK